MYLDHDEIYQEEAVLPILKIFNILDSTFIPAIMFYSWLKIIQHQTQYKQYKHTKLFHDLPNKKNRNTSWKWVHRYMLSTWFKSLTEQNSLTYFQSKLNPEIDPTCRLCLQANETLHHLMTDCEATISLQMDILKNQIPLPARIWSVKDINKIIQHPQIHSLMTYDTKYNNKEI